MFDGLQRYSYIFCYIIISFLVVGCKKNSKPICLRHDSGSDYREMIALHSEIPDVMLGFEVDRVMHDLNNQEIVEIVYKAKKGVTINYMDARRSYVADMELLGWKQIGEFLGETIQLLFERPRSNVLCSIYIEQNDMVRVTLLQKKEGLL